VRLHLSRVRTALPGYLAAALVGLIAVAGCAPAAPSRGPSGRVMLIGGEGYIVEQLTAGTWSATAVDNRQPAAQPATRSALLDAIEAASGCKVSDSDYSQGGQQLDAQVNCPGPAN
jgi:hypothetical protein